MTTSFVRRWLGSHSPDRSLRSRFALALGTLLLLAGLNAVAFSWGSARRNDQRDQMDAALLRYTTVTQLRGALESESRRIQTLASLVGLGTATATERADADERLDALEKPLSLLLQSSAATPASRTLAAKTQRLANEWRGIYRAQDPSAAVERLVIAELLARELLTADYPTIIAAASTEMQATIASNRRNDRMVATFTWIMLICSGGFGAWVVVGLSRRLIRDVETLRNGAAMLGAGDLDFRIATGSRDELGSVADSFDATRLRLRDAHQRLEAEHRELESTVAKLRETQNELVQSEKLSALGGMLAGLAHELNNPLAAILATSELLDQQLAECTDPAMRELGRELGKPLVRESLRARGLVGTLLRFARDTELVLQPSDLADAVNQATQLRRHQFAHDSIELAIDVPAGLHVRAEPLRLQQICLNIITNAGDALAGGKGTKLRIAARALPVNKVELVFEDDGPGMSHPERVFEPFFTTKEVGKGTGLGLSIVHRLVTEFGGTIVAENLPWRGARFAITLDGALVSQPRRKTPVFVAMPSVMPARILVVDDEPALRSVQERLLQRAGFEVTVAGSAEEARVILKQSTPDLVISDIKMPGEDGVSLYDWANRMDEDLASRFLFVTGDVQATLISRLGSELPARVMQKPFVTSEYLATVKSRLAALNTAAIAT